MDDDDRALAEFEPFESPCVDCGGNIRIGFSSPGQSRCFSCGMKVLEKWRGKPPAEEAKQPDPHREE